MMQQRVFYLHEDEWAMIDLLPAENVAEVQWTAHEAQAFGEQHCDGFGWTDMYILPRPTHPLSLRAIPLNELKAMLRERFLPADSVQSGYSSYRETLPDCFAFVEAEKADGAFYGDQENGLVTRLHLLPCIERNHARLTSFIDILHALGAKYDLVLVDWWNTQIIDLRERNRVVQYLEASSH
jgi:hypothetical protein